MIVWCSFFNACTCIFSLLWKKSPKSPRTRFRLAVEAQCNLMPVSQKVDSSPGEGHITFLGMPWRKQLWSVCRAARRAAASRVSWPWPRSPVALPPLPQGCLTLRQHPLGAGWLLLGAGTSIPVLRGPGDEQNPLKLGGNKQLQSEFCNKKCKICSI